MIKNVSIHYVNLEMGKEDQSIMLIHYIWERLCSIQECQERYLDPKKSEVEFKVEDHIFSKFYT